MLRNCIFINLCYIPFWFNTKVFFIYFLNTHFKKKKKKFKPFALKSTSYPIIKIQRISETPPNPLNINF